MKHSISAILAALLLSSALISCGEAASAPADTKAVGGDTPNAPEETETEAAVPSGVPDDVDLGGEVIDIWYTVKAVSVAETFVDIAGELNGDMLDDAIYNANIRVEEKLNCDLNFFSADVTTSDTGATFSKLMKANDTAYDLFHLVQWNASKFAAEGMYLNMNDAKYLSFDQPWWDYTYMKEMTIGEDIIYSLVGDYAVDRTRCLGCVYYNKALYADFYSDADGLYQEVLDHKWTMERMREISAEIYQDINNNGTADREDRLGYCINNYNNLDLLFTGGGARTTARDKDDLPYLVLNSDRNISVADKVYEMALDTVGTFCSGSVYEEDVENRKMFENGYSMFLIGFFYTAEAMRDMKSDYGIVPVPLYDGAQEQYVSDVHDIMRIMAVPYNCTCVDAVSAILEELSYQGYQNVLPNYYDVLMKNKYARDSISASMIDLIRDNCTPDIAHIYGDSFNQMGYICRQMVQSKKPFASTYASKEKTALKNMQKFIDDYMAANE